VAIDIETLAFGVALTASFCRRCRKSDRLHIDHQATSKAMYEPGIEVTQFAATAATSA
jgi:hypothetical protein